MKTAAIIPAFNEFQRLRTVIEEARQYVDEIIVVDDGSRTPLAPQLPVSPTITVLRHLINLGKGAAMTTGIQCAQQRGIQAIVFLDADGQHAPAEIPHLLAPIIAGQAEIAFGVRKFHQAMPFVARFGNLFLSRVLAILFGINVADTQSGFRALLVTAYPKLAWRSPRYAVETEMIVNAGKNHVRFVEVPIKTIYLDKYKGTTVLDGLRIFFQMISWRLL